MADRSSAINVMIILLPLLLGTNPVHSFLSPSPHSLSKISSSSSSSPCLFPPSFPSHHEQLKVSTTELSMAKSKTKKKKKKKASSSTGGLKGFGGSSSSGSSKSTAGGGGIIDRSPSALKFYDYLQRNDGGGSNLKRVGLGYFPLQIGPSSKDDIIQLRGVIALRDIPKGEPIIEIPYEMALDLGRESADPTLPATAFLQKYCAWKSSSDSVPPGDKERGDYFAMLPGYLSDDCLGSTDFFSEGALVMLQSPGVVEETKSRREMVQARYERDVRPMAEMSSNLYRWEDGSSKEGEGDTIATESHLQWASWIITSRVLTVQGAPESNTANRVLIPLIDMCNHDRDSPHILTGRAMPGGMLKVVAGADIKTGDAVNIGYGGSVEGNDRFVQDYGFLDAGGSKERGKKKTGDNGGEFVAEAYKIVARKLVGRGGRSIARVAAAAQERELDALGATSLEDDEALLASGNVVKSDERMALEYRIGMKKALAEMK